MVYFVEDPTSRYELKITPTDGKVVISAKIGANNLRHIWCVSPPNFIDKIRGITFEQKVEKTKTRAQKKIDKLNAAIERANKVAGVKPFDLSNPPKGGTGVSSRPPIPQPVKITKIYTEDDLK